MTSFLNVNWRNSGFFNFDNRKIKAFIFYEKGLFTTYFSHFAQCNLTVILFLDKF